MTEPIRFTVEKAEEKKHGVQLKEVYKKLYESEKYLRTIIDSSIDGIAVVDEQGKIEFGNDSFFDIVGWPRDELIGQSFIKMLTDDTKELYLKIWQEYQNSAPNTGQVAEAKIVTRDGEIRYLYKSRVATVINGQKKFIFIARNISDRKKLESDLKESEAKYRELFENAQDAMYVLDTEDNFLKMNNVGLRILGCTKEEVIGTNISKWLTQESLKIAEDRRKKWNLGEIVDKTDTLELVSKNGEHRWIEIKTRHIKDGDRIIEIHGIARDVTENIILKQELKNSNEQRKLLCYLIKGTRGGKTRTLILRHLIERSYNAHQLAKTLGMNYKTVRHHLGVLVKNGIVTRGNDGCIALYFISKDIESELSEFNSELR
jgi:two-component system cell cycle sensor histidine kinase/response regulator CckA